ncbi:MAG: hypothetical protein ACJAWC_000292 [Yoonia sp.]|jgi:hypothetical protein
MVGTAGDGSGSYMQVENTSFVGTVTALAIPANQKPAMTACYAAPTKPAWRWAAKLERLTGLLQSPKECGSGLISANSLKLNGVKIKPINNSSQSLRTF